LANGSAKLPFHTLAQHKTLVIWEIEFTDEFGAWWNLLSEQEQESIADGR